MIKTGFDEAFAKQRGTRTLLPAEACSELGVTSVRLRSVRRLPRWLPFLGRWLLGRRSSPHG